MCGKFSRSQLNRTHAQTAAERIYHGTRKPDPNDGAAGTHAVRAPCNIIVCEMDNQKDLLETGTGAAAGAPSKYIIPAAKQYDSKKRKRGVMSQSEQEALCAELESYEQSGCAIYLNGNPSRPEQVVRACVREHSRYMRDILSDETNKIMRIDFIKIR